MNFSKGIQEKVVQFAQEQAPHYFAAAETANTETNKPKAKAAAKYAEEATNDFSLYMLDYMQDLLSQGLSEEAAFQKAAEQLAASSDSAQHDDLNAHFRHYYEDFDPATMEKIGLFYGGMTVIGLGVGGLIGFLASGGIPAFLASLGWVYTAIGALAGVLIGVGIGLLGHALTVSKMKNTPSR